MARMKKKTLGLIDAQWESYRAAVVPDGATPGQIRQIHYAFMGGAIAAVKTLMMLGDKAVNEDAAVILFEDVRLECENFLKTVEHDERKRS
jgi:hypothetical protein